ncbi:TetR/AcrR family transcriptional regulator [Agromyces sp. NPDC058484]|uniref:TetR/AcrR family transcriptional regulator n=1 Tax=Agromyces sp. NPDC058484 TaxID=3346524 RepID=UPI00366529B8
MSPQPSNRSALLEGALRCVGSMPLELISARALASEANANLASIGYHFGSKDGLVTAAVVESLDRWLASIGEQLSAVDDSADGSERFHQAAVAIDATRAAHQSVARAFVVALARGHHDKVVADHLIEGFMHTRPRVAKLLGLGDDDIGTDAGGLVHALFTGLLVQSLLSDELSLDADRVVTAFHRIAETITPYRSND